MGPFTINLPIPEPLVWKNQNSITTVTRSQGLPITWSGADSSDIRITGYSFTGLTSASPFGAAFYCTAKGSDHQFTVPSIVLLSLPPSESAAGTGVTTPTGSLSVGSSTPLQSFTATGLDKGFVLSSVYIGQSVTYQ